MVTRKAILKAIGCKHLDLVTDRVKLYSYFVYDDGQTFDTRSVYVAALNRLSLEEWALEGKQLELRCKLQTATARIAKVKQLKIGRAA